MKKIELEIVALSHSITQSQNYAVVLGETDGGRRLPIVIGGFEAQAIAVAMEQMVPSRPLTHDLIKNILDSFNIDVKEVVINNLVDGIFYARLVCLLNGERVEIDSRTSDALALAVRFECPIFTFDFILDQAGVVLEERAEREVQDAKSKRKKRSSMEDLSNEELEQALNDALQKEDYERAAQLRDEIKRRGQ